MTYYGIYHSGTGALLIPKAELDEALVESLAGLIPGEHFRAGNFDALTDAGIDPEQFVYAIVHYLRANRQSDDNTANPVRDPYPGP